MKFLVMLFEMFVLLRRAVRYQSIMGQMRSLFGTIGCKLRFSHVALAGATSSFSRSRCAGHHISPDTLYFQTMYTHMQFAEGRNRTAPQLEYHDVAPREQEQSDHVQKFSRRILSFQQHWSPQHTIYCLSRVFFFVFSSGSLRFGLSVIFERSSLFWMILQRCCRIQ